MLFFPYEAVQKQKGQFVLPLGSITDGGMSYTSKQSAFSANYSVETVQYYPIERYEEHSKVRLLP